MPREKSLNFLISSSEKTNSTSPSFQGPFRVLCTHTLAREWSWVSLVKANGMIFVSTSEELKLVSIILRLGFHDSHSHIHEQ